MSWEHIKRFLGVGVNKVAGPHPQQHLPFDAPDEDDPIAGRCCQCGRTKNDDGSSVTWECCSCHRKVCRHCTLTMPDGHPDQTIYGVPQYYEDTLCSEKCRIVAHGEDELSGRR